MFKRGDGKKSSLALNTVIKDRGLLNPPHRKCSAKPPTRRGLTRLFSYLVNRTVEDGSKIDIFQRQLHLIAIKSLGLLSRFRFDV